MSLFISDGCTEWHTIKARGNAPALEVSFRPALTREVNQWRRDGALVKDGTGEAACDAAFLARHLVNWDAGCPLTAEILQTLRPTIFAELLNVVAGHVVPNGRGETKQGELEKNSASAS